MTPVNDNNLIARIGQKWHQRRKLLTSAFHFNILKQFSYTIIAQTEELMNRIQVEVGNSKTDLKPIITRATLRIMCGKYNYKLNFLNKNYGIGFISIKYIL